MESSSEMAKITDALHGSDHLALDCRGMNFYRIDHGLQDLLKLYMDPNMFAHLEPRYDRLGELAGGKLDELAEAADKHAPVLPRAIGLAATPTGSNIIPPTARWSSWRSGNSASMR